MMTEDRGEMLVDGKHIEVISHFIFLGISNNQGWIL